MDILTRRIGLDEDVIPQAIFSRPIKYFSTYVRSGQDDLDNFDVSTFQIGNYLTFDLRRYHGHPEGTVSLYFPAYLGVERVGTKIDAVISGLKVPKLAVAWRRGWDFKYGELKRQSADRLCEPEARVLALKVAARKKDRTATTEEIKKEIGRIYPLSPKDQEIASRNEPLWRQIVGNVISHRSSPAGLFRKGYAERTDRGLRVTDAGMEFLNTLGFIKAD